MAFFLPRKLLATAVLAALTLPGLAQAETAAAAAPAVAAIAAPAPAAEAAPAARAGARAHYRNHHRGHHRMQMMHGDQAQGASSASWQERRAAHQVQLKEQLQLSPAQAMAWAEFTAAMEHTPSHARLGWEGMEQLTTPERIDRMRAMQAQRAADMDRRGDAVKAFYTQLNPTQQKTFDAHHRSNGGQYQRMGGPRGGAMSGPKGRAAGAGKSGWQHPECVMDDAAPGNTPAAQ